MTTRITRLLVVAAGVISIMVLMLGASRRRSVGVTRSSTARDLKSRTRAERALRQREHALRQSYRENQALAGRLIVAQEAERRRIARDLHDDLSQKLALLNVEMDRTLTGGDLDRQRLEQRVHALSEFIAEIASDVHDLSHELHPSRLETLGLVTALEALCRDVSRKYGIVVAFHRDAGGAPRLDPELSLHLYRIVQEALHNIVKHSGAARALVELALTPHVLDLRITDHGRGFVPGGRSEEGLGLISMRERANIIGARLSVESSPGEGTRLLVHMPVGGDRTVRQARVGSPAESA